MTVTPSGLTQASIVPLTTDRNVLGESPVWDAVKKPAPWAKQSGPGTVLAA